MFMNQQVFTITSFLNFVKITQKSNTENKYIFLLIIITKQTTFSSNMPFQTIGTTFISKQLYSHNTLPNLQNLLLEFIIKDFRWHNELT